VSLEAVEIVNEFVESVKKSLEDETFVSIILRGPAKAKQQQQQEKEQLRGCIRQVQGRLIALRSNSSVLLQTTIKYHGATDVSKNYKVNQVPAALNSLLLLDSNAVASEWGKNTLHPCGTDLGIQTGELRTTLGTWELSAKKPIKLKFRATVGKLGRSAQQLSHDRCKEVPLEAKSSFLQALGLTNPDGKPRPAMSSKLKQCQKFVEIVSGLLSASILGREVSAISTVDMGCGRGYLTFSLHSYLHDKYGEMVRTCGIDVRPKLVKEISDVARSLGSNFDGLTFQEGTIQGVLSEPQENESSCLKVLIALHACDTATDDALWSGIQSGADIIVVAPCCHKEVRRQLDRHVASTKLEHPLADVLRHNIYRERIAETVTDSLRALLLELANYNVQVFEFIGGEHTGKNVMITAVKRRRSLSEKQFSALRERLRALAKLHGVETHCLATWMGVTFAQVNDAPPKRKLSTKEMPPL
jgi:hypothetical protein